MGEGAADAGCSAMSVQVEEHVVLPGSSAAEDPVQAWPKQPLCSAEGAAGTLSHSTPSSPKNVVQENTFPTPKGVSWQWEHRTGFRDYSASQNAKIEFAYQRGDAKVRLKSGKEGCTPMELFFVDMVQLDTTSGNQRRVRRLGRLTWYGRLRRKVKEFIRSWETGQPRRQTIKKYKSRQEQLEGENIGLSVRRLYSETSCCGKIVRSNTFGLLSTATVFINIVWLGIDVDYNSGSSFQDSPAFFQVVEFLFCAAFSAELTIRFVAFRRKRDFILDPWFCFDLVLVSLMIFETMLLPGLAWVSMRSSGRSASSGTSGALRNVNVLRMARLLKLTRMSRLLKALPELMTMLRGIVAALRSVAFTLLLEVLLLYIFGIVFVTWSKAHGYVLMNKYFENLLLAMYSLLIHGTFLDGPSGPLKDMISVGSPALVCLFLMFIVVSAFTVLNMLVGLLFQVVADVREAEQRKHEWDYLRYSLLDILECYDRDEDQTLGKEEFTVLMKNPEVRDVLQKVGTDLDDMLIMADVVFSETTASSRAGKLTFEELLQVINRLRGARAASVTDVVEMRQYLRHCIEHVKAELRDGQRELLSNVSCSRLGPEGPQRTADAAPVAAVAPATVLVRLELQGRVRTQLRRRTTPVGELLQEVLPRHGRLVAKDMGGIEMGAEITFGELIDPSTGQVSLRLVEEAE